jgi:hypothetical protein
MWTKKSRAKYNRDHLRYPSDLTNDEWTLVKPFIPRQAKLYRFARLIGTRYDLHALGRKPFTIQPRMQPAVNSATGGRRNSELKRFPNLCDLRLLECWSDAR